MTSKEALDHLIEYFKDFEDMPAIMKEELNIISKDLDRLEKLEKAFNIIRWCQKTLETLRTETSDEEYKFITKEVIEND